MLRQPEVCLSTTTFEIVKWFGQELTELWMDKPKDKERNIHAFYMYCMLLRNIYI